MSPGPPRPTLPSVRRGGVRSVEPRRSTACANSGPLHPTSLPRERVDGVGTLWRAAEGGYGLEGSHRPLLGASRVTRRSRVPIAQERAAVASGFLLGYWTTRTSGGS